MQVERGKDSSAATGGGGGRSRKAKEDRPPPPIRDFCPLPFLPASPLPHIHDWWLSGGLLGWVGRLLGERGFFLPLGGVEWALRSDSSWAVVE